VSQDDGLAWIRLDTKMPMNKKILRLVKQANGGAAAFMWVCSLTHSGLMAADGFISDEELHLIHGKKSLATLLVKAELWERDDARGGWTINDYTDYNQTRETTRIIRQTKTAGAIRGNHKKHHEGQPVKCNCAERIEAIESGKKVPPAMSESLA
jgi:hypothetical protein